MIPRTGYRPPARRASGFALAITLWLLAAMAVAAGLAMLWAREEVQASTRDRDLLVDEIDLASTRATLLYMAATRDLTLGGLPIRAISDDERALRRLDEFGSLRLDARGDEIRLDGAVYKGVGQSRFSIQDEAGLIPLVAPSPNLIDRLLAFRGTPPESIPRLRDTLLDYVDSDSLGRLNGAESRDYERAGRRPPPNRRLLIPAELGAVLGWDALPGGTSSLADLTTTFYSGAANLNTAPEALLPIWIAGCPEKCRVVTARRALKAFRSSGELELTAAVRLPGDRDVDYRYLAGDTLRFTFWGRSGSASRMHVRLTPLADQVSPWAVLAAYPVSRPSEHAPAQSTGSDLFADPTSAVR